MVDCGKCCTFAEEQMINQKGGKNEQAKQIREKEGLPDDGAAEDYCAPGRHAADGARDGAHGGRDADARG